MRPIRLTLAACLFLLPGLAPARAQDLGLAVDAVAAESEWAVDWMLQIMGIEDLEADARAAKEIQSVRAITPTEAAGMVERWAERITDGGAGLAPPAPVVHDPRR